MTECERIQKEGILPASFFEEEVRCDFLVDKQRKKLWAVQLDMMLQLDAVCKKHGLKYFLCGGSLLGAIRHHGYIPWDDDIDVGMMRDDYNKLLALAGEFKTPYFLQTPYTDPYSAFTYTRLCNVNTTEANELFTYQPMCLGIWIDILPWDNWKEDDYESFEEIKRLNLENGTYMRLLNPWLNEKDKKRVAGWSGEDPKVVYEKVNKLASQYNGAPTKYVMNSVSTLYPYEKKIRPAEWYADVEEAEFETCRFMIPVGAVQILENQYGDYMKLPPTDKRGGWHGDVHVDPDTPYTVFLENYRNSRT